MMKTLILKIKNHLIGFLVGIFATTAVTAFAASNPGSLGSLFTDIGGGIYKLIGTNIKDGSITPAQIGFNGGLSTTSVPTFKGIFSTNKSEFGNTVSNYLPSGGNWNYTLQLNGNNNTSIGFHDAGTSVSSIKYGPTGFEIGGNDGWGVKQVSIPGGIKFADGTIQTSAAVTPSDCFIITPANKNECSLRYAGHGFQFGVTSTNCNVDGVSLSHPAYSWTWHGDEQIVTRVVDGSLWAYGINFPSSVSDCGGWNLCNRPGKIEKPLCKLGTTLSCTTPTYDYGNTTISVNTTGITTSCGGKTPVFHAFQW